MYLDQNGTKKRYSPCPDWFPAWRLGTDSGGAAASSSLTGGRASFEYIPSLEAGNEATHAFRLFLVPFYSTIIRPNPQPLPYKGRGENQSLSPTRRKEWK
jgi:hypothetical protein